MTLTLARQEPGPHSTLGTLTIADTEFAAHTLEPGTERVQFGRIPPGTYEVAMRDSPKHGYRVPGLLDVPDRTDIEIHVGNYPHDTLGCALVGYTASADFVGGSQHAFADLVARIEAAEASVDRVWLTITEPEAA